MWQRMHRFLQLTWGYLMNIGPYISYARLRHAITGPLRMARANLLKEEFHAQKHIQEQVATNVFIPGAIFCETHGTQYVSGFQDVTTCPQCLYEQRQKAIGTLWLEHADPEHPGQLLKAYGQQFKGEQIDRVPTLKVAEYLPGSRPTRPFTQEELEEAAWLLSGPVGIDPDETVPRLRAQKAG